MARLFDSGIFSVNTSSGALGSGWKLYFYAAGTSTPKNTYTTNALATPNANPVVADANGRFGPIWLSDGGYKVILKDASDVTIVTRDPADDEGAGLNDRAFTVETYADIANTNIPSSSDSFFLEGYTTAGDGGGSFYFRTASEPSHPGKAQSNDGAWWELGAAQPTPQMFGAVGDGATNDGAAFDDFFSFTGETGNGLIPKATYKITTPTGFSVPTGVHISAYGAVLDFSGASTASRIRITGTIGSAITLSANVSAGGATLPLSSVSGVTVGALLLVSSDDLVPLSDIGGSTTETIGEFVTVKSISGTTVTIDGYLDGSYLTADNAKVQVVSGSEGVTIEGLKLIGRGTNGDGTSSLEIGFSATYARSLRLRDVEVYHVDYQAIALDQCFDWLIDNPSIQHEDRGNVAYDIIQYGIAPKNCTSKGRIQGGTIIGGKHGIVWTENSLPGVGRDVAIFATQIIGTWAAGIATHESNERFDILFPRLIGCERALDIRVRSGRIIGPHIRNIPSSSSIGDGIYLSEAAGNITIALMDMDGGRYGIRMYDVGLPASATPSEITIQGGKIRNINQIGIYLEHSENSNAKRGITIKDVDLTDCAGDFIRLNGLFDGAVIRGCFMSPIDVASIGYGVRLMGTTDTVVSGNHFGPNLTPVRTEVSTESVPATPTNIFLVNNTWETTGGFLSSTAASNVVRKNNIQKGSQSLTIATGAITAPIGHQFLTIDTESAAASDDLDTISGGDIGDIVTFAAVNAARTVVFKDGTGNLDLNGDFSADNSTDTITLLRAGSGWQEVCRSNNAA